MIDDELLQLYRTEVASNMTDKRLFTTLLSALEGEQVQRERALAIAYELRDRSEVFD